MNGFLRDAGKTKEKFLNHCNFTFNKDILCYELTGQHRAISKSFQQINFIHLSLTYFSSNSKISRLYSLFSVPKFNLQRKTIS